MNRIIHNLGFEVYEKGLQIGDDKIHPILEFPVPKNIKQLQQLIGMASMYRRFIPQFAEIIEPLNRLLKKNKKWEWGIGQTEAFEKIKKLLTSAPILPFLDVSQPFQLETDASDTGFRAALTQAIDRIDHVIAYASRNLNNTVTLPSDWYLDEVLLLARRKKDGWGGLADGPRVMEVLVSR